ncbi:MAG: hypothetical protein M1824_003863 [Vezdaea acicularis]|nr:MAG: hypothetical protein M1824_003863 [Vezdaea acicularis]
MTSYEVEHDIAASQPTRRRRPDLSTYFTALEQVETAGSQDRTHNNANAVPTPPAMAAVYRSLGEAFQVMQTDGEGNNRLLNAMIQMLAADAEAPPREVKGVSDEWLTGMWTRLPYAPLTWSTKQVSTSLPQQHDAALERIPKKSLKPKDSCPICGNPFLDDKYPLVVRLPCHRSHIFDLECITPWLKLHPTCPLDRKDLLEKEKANREEVRKAVENDDEEEWDDMYA